MSRVSLNLNRVNLNLNMRKSRRQTKVRVGEDRVNRSCQEEAACEQDAQTLHFALRASHTQLTAKGTMALNAQRGRSAMRRQGLQIATETRQAHSLEQKLDCILTISSPTAER